jgi:hypothetical protein
MDMEARSLAPDKGRPLQNKVREYKADLTSLREQLKQAAAGRAMGGQQLRSSSLCGAKLQSRACVLQCRGSSEVHCCELCRMEHGIVA